MTPSTSTDGAFGSRKQRERKHSRGMLAGKAGKTIGFTSLVAPVIGFVLNDLKKPDSLVRRLITGTWQKLITAKMNKSKTIDITDKVEILENGSQDGQPNDEA